jgi:sialidase-1
MVRTRILLAGSMATCLGVSASLPSAADGPIITEVFVSGEAEHYRIPSLVTATDGTLLAFTSRGTEGPQRGDLTVVLRRSFDGGETWSPIEEIGKGRLGAAVVDEYRGDVMVFVGSPVDMLDGEPHPIFLWRSRDHGRSWVRESPEIRPNLAGGVGCTHGSESGITLRYGKHRGRLLMPARVWPWNSNDRRHWPYHYNCAIYSDDGGQTWQTGGPVETGTGEGTLAELSDGEIYYNSRSHMAVDDRRRIARSRDGGETFVDWRVDLELYDGGAFGTGYGCNAGLLRLPLEGTEGRDVLLYSNPDTEGGDRERMTVWASFDRGATWPVKRLIFSGPAAYSSLAAGRDGTPGEGWVYLLFEGGPGGMYSALRVARFKLDWLAGETRPTTGR